MDHRKRYTLWLGLFCVLLTSCDSGTPAAPSPVSSSPGAPTRVGARVATVSSGAATPAESDPRIAAVVDWFANTYHFGYPTRNFTYAIPQADDTYTTVEVHLETRRGADLPWETDQATFQLAHLAGGWRVQQAVGPVSVTSHTTAVAATAQAVVTADARQMTTVRLRALSFADPTQGWAAGDYGFVRHYQAGHWGLLTQVVPGAGQ